MLEHSCQCSPIWASAGWFAINRVNANSASGFCDVDNRRQYLIDIVVLGVILCVVLCAVFEMIFGTGCFGFSVKPQTLAVVLNHECQISVAE